MTTLDLPADQLLEVETSEDGALITLRCPAGSPSLQIRVTEHGPEIVLGGPSVRIRVEGDLELAGRDLRLNAERDLELRAGGELTTSALGQDHTCRLGDFAVSANDDVKLNGERVKLNC